MKKSSPIKPLYPELKEEITYTGQYKQHDEQEIARAKGNLFIFNHEMRQFLLKAADIEAVIYQIGEWKDHICKFYEIFYDIHRSFMYRKSGYKTEINFPSNVIRDASTFS